MDNRRGLLGIRGIDKIPNEQIREMCTVMKEVDESFDEGVLQRFFHVERMENDRIAERVYVGECTGNRSVGRSRKRWNDTA